MDSSHLILASQGSLAGLELLAARGSMRPNGSMVSNSVYVNPFDPSPRKSGGRRPRSSPKHRGLKLTSRSQSNDLGSDLEFGSSLDNLELHNRFRKSRQQQLQSVTRSGSLGLVQLPDSRKQKQSQKSNNFVGALNQGLVSLGEKLVQEKTYSVVE